MPKMIPFPTVLRPKYLLIPRYVWRFSRTEGCKLSPGRGRVSARGPYARRKEIYTWSSSSRTRIQQSIRRTWSRGLHSLTDTVLLYDPDMVDVEHIRNLETPEAKIFAREKGLLDYIYLLRACESNNTPYTVMLEDDIIALDG